MAVPMDPVNRLPNSFSEGGYIAAAPNHFLVSVIVKFSNEVGGTATTDLVQPSYVLTFTRELCTTARSRPRSPCVGDRQGTHAMRKRMRSPVS